MFNPNQFWLNDQLNNVSQITPRCYTFISNHDIDQSFLCINNEFMYKTLIHTADKVLAEWSTFDETHYLHYIYVLVEDSDLGDEQQNLLLTSRIDDYIQAILVAEKSFFHENPSLLKSSIYVFFHSKSPFLDRIEYWGSFKDYKL